MFKYYSKLILVKFLHYKNSEPFKNHKSFCRHSTILLEFLVASNPMPAIGGFCYPQGIYYFVIAKDCEFT